MAKGILYVTTTTISGLVKIGKTTNFKERMRQLELDGYRGLLCKRAYAIEFDECDISLSFERCAVFLNIDNFQKNTAILSIQFR